MARGACDTGGMNQSMLFEIPAVAIVAVLTHLAVSGGQTVMHRYLGHRRAGGFLFRNHINFHHALYRKGQLASAARPDSEGDNTPFFVLPVALAAAGAWFVLPTVLFAVMVVTATVSFYAHVHFDNAYHVKDAWLGRFAWFRRKQQLHFVHHLHANANFAVIDFFWDRLLGTYRKAGTVNR